MTSLKIQSWCVFAIAIFTILAQAWGQNTTTTTTTEAPKTCRSGFPRSCSEISHESGSTGNSSKLESCLIYPNGATGNPVEVLCDFETEAEGGGWTLIQKRAVGLREEFQRNWTEYAKGFGSLNEIGNFWLGLENIHALTQNGDQELRIDLEDFQGEKRWAKYSSFSISDAADFYRLAISGFAGDSTAGDSMTDNNYESSNDGMRFSTKDVDNDTNDRYNCAVDLHGDGGWWFPENCGYSSLNGIYYGAGEAVQGRDGLYWFWWTGFYDSLAKSEMKIRTRK